MTLNEWIIKGRVGISSKTMWAVLQNVDHKGDKPYDPSDFGRCYDFVKKCNLAEGDLQKIARVLPYWKPYIDNWDKLTKMYEQNVKENWSTKKEIGMYEFMEGLRQQSELIKRNTGIE